MSNHFDELRNARKEGQPLHRSDTSSQMSNRLQELRIARREVRPLYQPNTAKKRDGSREEPHGSRHKGPSPHNIEHRRQEKVVEAYPKGDSPLFDALRRRSRSSPPRLTRAPTPHPRASAPHAMKKSVHWADPLEEPTPEKIRSERKGRNSEAPKGDGEESPKEGQSCTIRRYRPSSIPRPKRRSPGAEISKPSCSDRHPTPTFTIELVLAPQASQSPQRPLSPLIPQAMPAPLRISSIKTSIRRPPNTVSPSVSAPVVQAKPSTRSFSFEDQPEVITLSPDRRASHQHHAPPITQKRLSTSQPTLFSYLKEKPKRRGTIRPHRSETKPASAMVVAESSEPSLSSSSSTSSFHTAKSFWSDINEGSGENCDSSFESPSPIKVGPNEVILAIGCGFSSPSKAAISKIPTSSSSSTSSFHAAKSFWSDISSSSSCGAIIDGSEDAKLPCGPSSVAARAVVCKSSKVAELSRYTVNRPAYGLVKAQSSVSKSKIPIWHSEGGFVGSDRSKSRIPVSSTASYHVTRTQQSRYVPLRAVSGVSAPRYSLRPPAGSGSSMSGFSSSSSFHTAKSHPSDSSDNNTYASGSKTSILQSNDSVQAEVTPSLQSQLWNDVLKLCSSNLSSCSPDCDCGACIWSHQDDVDRCSMVAQVDDAECRER